jgi:hypothetical protein
MMDCVRAAPAVINAFAVMGIFVAIFAVAAFNLSADSDPDNFGTFFRALSSMFQVCAARCTLHCSWNESIVGKMSKYRA